MTNEADQGVEADSGDRELSERSFRPRDAALEYWFWKFRAGELAFLVDFIIRRNIGEAEIRVSQWVRGQGRVARRTSSSWTATNAAVLVDGQRLTADGSVGSADDIEWNLRWRSGPYLVGTRPVIFGPLHPLDMEHSLLPDARFAGEVTIRGERFEVADAPGLVMHYWGRRLADRWCWISASEFVDDPHRRVEALIGRSSLWGNTRIQMTGGYVWTVDSSSPPSFSLSPVNALVRERRSDDSVTLTSVRLAGRRHRIECRADPAAFNDLGEGIRQTLMADLVIDGHPAVPGTTGLEFRG